MRRTDSAKADRSDRRIRVLQSVRLDVSERSYMNHLADAIDSNDVELLSFSWGRALLGRWDVLHVHWPEGLLSAASYRRKVLRALQFIALLARISVWHKSVLRTVHNTTPHEPGHPLESRLLALLDNRVTVFVALNPYTDIPGGAPPALIPHGDYRHLVSCSPLAPCRQGDLFNLLFFGFLKPYKGVERLLEVFRSVASDDLRLHICGRATPGLRSIATSAAEQDRRITLFLDFADDPMLDDELRRAHLVVLPYPEIHNSGAMIHALSAGRPVLVVRNDVTDWIASECGPGWVHFFDAPLSVAALRAAIAAVRGSPPTSPLAFANRSWDYSAQQYQSLYRTAAGR